MEKMSDYVREGDWSGFSVTKTARGWVIDQWSQIQGTITGSKTLIPFSVTFPADIDLDDAWNEHMTYGDAIMECGEGGKVIKRGHIVQ